MTSGPPSRYGDLAFNAPLSDAHARDLVAGLEPLAGRHVVDLACGWAELLLRVVATEPTARGTGVDLDPDNIARGRSEAGARGLGDRVGLECGDATAWSGAADVVIVIGASRAWGGARATLDAVRPLLPRGGRLLLGEAVWEAAPTPTALTALDAAPDDFLTVGDLVDVCRERGFGLLSLSTASMSEWDSFESRYCATHERWLLAHPGAPEAAAVRRELDTHRRGWLHGYRGVLGFAYLTLGV